MTKLKNLVMEFGTVLKLAGYMGALVIFLYTTFATKDYVNARVESVIDILRRVETDVSLVKKCVLFKQCEY